jgi:hypothetical protein
MEDDASKHTALPDRILELLEAAAIPVTTDALRFSENGDAYLYRGSQIQTREWVMPRNRFASPFSSGPCCASVAGFSVHAGVCVPARDRLRLERLCRYTSPPPLATGRLSLLRDGRLLYRLKRRWRDGTTHGDLRALGIDGTARSACTSSEVQYHKVLRNVRACGKPPTSGDSGGRSLNAAAASGL